MKERARLRAACAVALFPLILSACATLPSSGPTGTQIYGAEKSTENELGFRIVELNTIASLPPAMESISNTPQPLAPGREWQSNLIGANDILDIAIYEAGIALFSGGNMLPDAGALDAGAKSERLPPIRVDDAGFIILPYAGRIMAAGHTTTELQNIIQQALVGRSQNPQVMVSQRRSVNNSVMLSGEVASSGRQMLETNRETILDVISMAGGYRGEPSDLIVKVDRGGQSSEYRLDDLQRSEAGVMRVFPGDRITLLKDPESFSVLGAAGHTAQIPFNRPSMSLAEAVARSGGSDENQGDPAAIFVFRFVRESDGSEKPLVYHLNMMNAGAYFLAQKFVMRDRDVLYVGNAKANQPRKMVQTLSQLFTPIATVRAVTR